MQCERCRSYAINPGQNGRGDDDLHLCDVCYWRARAEEKPSVDAALAAACKEWLKGCTCVMRMAETRKRGKRGMRMSDLYHWTFKYNDKPWRVTAWAARREPVTCSPGEFDRVWGWGIWAGHAPKLIASGEITGQLDELPHLSAILLDWQATVAGAVVTAIEIAKPGHEHPAEQRTGEV